MDDSEELGFYEPSDQLIDAQKAQFNDESLSNISAVFKDYLQTKTLSFANVHEVFKVLLTLEDLTCMLEYTKLSMKDICVDGVSGTCTIHLNKNSANFENIIEPLLDQVVIVPKASLLADGPAKDGIKTLLKHPHESSTDPNIHHRVGTVYEVSSKEVNFYLVIPDTDLKLDRNRRYDIIFRSLRVPERFQYRALELLSLNMKVRQYLFPDVNPNKTSPVFPTLNLINPTIRNNKEQLQAISHVVAGPNSYAPYIIFGPPGTGKTTTIVEAILQLRLHRPGSRILVTAGSNSACDTIALRICEYSDSNPNIAMPFIRYYSKTIFRKKKNNIPQQLLHHCNYLDGERMTIDAIAPYKIVIATLCCVGVFGICELADCFTHVFIDEAGASSEPETIIGIVNTKWNDNCHIILSGDHKQLGPVIKSKRAAQLGLGQSMMERLLQRECYALDANGNYDITLQTRLRRNYRSHPEIVQLYNHLYYNNELIAEATLAEVNMASEWLILPNPDFPIIFQAVHGKFMRSDKSPSSFNTLEVEQVKWYLSVLLRFGINDKKVTASDIGVISPYRAQCEKITNATRGSFLERVEVGSVEMFQGREKPIIIASFVRSYTNLGFVSNPRRLNVILSRAKSLLILIGNPKTLSQNNDFNFLIEECIQKGTYLSKKNDSKSKAIITLMRALDIATKMTTLELENGEVAAKSASQRHAYNRKRRVNKSTAKIENRVAGQQNQQIKSEKIKQNYIGDLREQYKNVLEPINETKQTINKQNSNKELSTEVAVVEQQKLESKGINKLQDANNEIFETKAEKCTLDEQEFDNCLLNQQKSTTESISFEEINPCKGKEKYAQSAKTDEYSKAELALQTLTIQETNDVNVGDIQTKTINLDRLRNLFIEQAQIVKHIECAIFAPNKEMLSAAELGLDLNQLRILEICAEGYTNGQSNDITECSEPMQLAQITNILEDIIKKRHTIKELQESIAQLNTNCCTSLPQAMKNDNEDMQSTYTKAELLNLNPNNNHKDSNSTNELDAVNTVSNIPHVPLRSLLAKAEGNQSLQNILNACDESCPIYHYFRLKLCCAELENFVLS